MADDSAYAVFIRKLEETGEDEVRKNLARNTYVERRKKWAEEWLDQKDRARTEEEARRAEASKHGLSILRSAAKAAADANKLSEEANGIARAANGLSEEANANSKWALRVSWIALIVAVIAALIELYRA